MAAKASRIDRGARISGTDTLTQIPVRAHATRTDRTCERNDADPACFGIVLAAGDFDHDGLADVAIGADGGLIGTTRTGGLSRTSTISGGEPPSSSPGGPSSARGRGCLGWRRRGTPSVVSLGRTANTRFVASVGDAGRGHGQAPPS